MVMPRPRARSGLVALGAVAALCLLAPVARADTIAVVSDGVVSQGPLDAPDELEGVVDGAVGVAYDRDGRLWFSRGGNTGNPFRARARSPQPTAGGPSSRPAGSDPRCGGSSCTVRW